MNGIRLLARLFVRLSAGLAVCALAHTTAWAEINVKTCCGATGNGLTDDTAAIALAFSLVPASGGELYIPAGTYKLTRTLGVMNQSISLRGDGQRATMLRWDTPGGDGLVYYSTTPANTTLTIKSLSLLRAGGASGGAAIFGVWSPTGTSSAANGLVTASITDINIAQSPYYTASAIGWLYGIRLVNATSARISNFAINGGRSSNMEAGISLEGKSNASYISSGEMVSLFRGIRMLDASDRVHVTDVEIVDVWDGIFAYAGRGTAIQGCHVNAIRAGIIGYNLGEASIANNLIYQYGTQPWSGINITGFTPIGGTRIIGNAVYGNVGATPSSFGYVIDGSVADTIIEGNVARNVFFGVWLKAPGVRDSIVMGNKLVVPPGIRGLPIVNNGIGSYIMHNP